MKRVLLVLFCSVLLFSLQSCGEKIDDTVRPVSLNATTQGFVGSGAETFASWLSSDKISLLSSEDWSVALLEIASGAGSTQAQFTGNSRGSARYYAVRPDTALTSVSNGVLNIEVEPFNILLSNEDSNCDLPQLGIGDKKGLSFSHLFGAVQFNLPNGCNISSISVKSSNKGVYGSYAYDAKTDVISPIAVVDNLTREFDEPQELTLFDAVFVAIPAASGVTVEITMSDAAAGVLYSCTANNLNIERGKVCSVDASHMKVLPVAVGDWHLVSFCGMPASVDLYLSIAQDQNQNRTFTLYQRSGSLDYSVFTGTWSYDEENKTISGTYSNGAAWATSYNVSLTPGGDLLMVDVNNSAEVSLYERAEMPKVSASCTSVDVDIKPLL